MASIDIVRWCKTSRAFIVEENLGTSSL